MNSVRLEDQSLYVQARKFLGGWDVARAAAGGKDLSRTCRIQPARSRAPEPHSARKSADPQRHLSDSPRFVAG